MEQITKEKLIEKQKEMKDQFMGLYSLSLLLEEDKRNKYVILSRINFIEKEDQRWDFGITYFNIDLHYPWHIKKRVNLPEYTKNDELLNNLEYWYITKFGFQMANHQDDFTIPIFRNVKFSFVLEFLKKIKFGDNTAREMSREG